MHKQSQESFDFGHLQLTQPKDSTPGEISSVISFASNSDDFQSDYVRSMSEEARLYPFCMEPAVLHPDGPFYADPTVYPLSKMLFNSAAASVGRAGAQSCEELRGYCNEGS